MERLKVSPFWRDRKGDAPSNQGKEEDYAEGKDKAR